MEINENGGKSILSSREVLLYLQFFQFTANAVNLLLLWYSNCLLPLPRDSCRAEEEEVKWGGAVYRHFIAVTH